MHLENRDIRKEVQIICHLGKDQLVSESVSKTCVRFAPLFSLVVGQCFRFRPVCQLMRMCWKKLFVFFNKNEITSFFGRVSSLFSWVHFLPQPPSCPLRFSQKLVAPQQTWTWICSKYHESHESGKMSRPWPSLNRITFWPLRHSPARSVVFDVF